MFTRHPLRIVVVATVALGLGACGASSSQTGATPTTTANTSTAPAQTSAVRPSVSARMICEPEAHDDIAEAIGINTIAPLASTYTDGLYACTYVYATGRMRLSVRELPDRAATAAYFEKMRRQLGVRSTWDGLGEGAFTAKDGTSVVVRKADKVLLVDVRALPSQVGVPLEPRADAALSVAATIMGCWTGA